PSILWAEIESRSHGKSNGSFPAAWTASTCSGTPASRQSAATSRSGKITPVSLFAAITEQSDAPGNAARSAARSSSPDRETGTRTQEATDAHAPSTAGCSTAVVTTLQARPRSTAKATDSVTPEV